MFEAAEVGHRVPKKEYAERAAVLREALLKTQYALLARPDFPVVLIIGGVDGAGKGETVNLLNEWMDPRFIITRAFGAPTDEEAQRPPMWRFWQVLPPKGRIGILFGSWYTTPIIDRSLRHSTGTQFYEALEHIKHFEAMLAADGVLILKFWFHLSKKAQKKRLDALEADPLTRWRVTAQDRAHFKVYDRFREISELALRETSTGAAPWHIIEGGDPGYRSLCAGQLLLDAMNARLQGVKLPLPAAPPASEPKIDARNVLTALDYGKTMESKAFTREMTRLHRKLALLTRSPKFQKRSLILVFEGQDAAGKGGTIRHIVSALDARHYGIIPVAAPTEEERQQPYLWRFWRHLPRLGRVTIFDRSWYGRVLVERVEGFCSEYDWQRAYGEINEYEAQLVTNGAIVLKFWLAITPEEQLARFHERENTPYKTFKITEEDWRNREKWPLYERAVCDMVEHTSTSQAPWHLVPSNDKHYARAAVLRTVCKVLEAELGAAEEGKE
jgi:polyphosphate:AMP phosphotransferase